MSSLQFNNKELHFLQQGMKALLDETAAQRSALLKRQHPDDNNTSFLLEYYDKRIVELKALENKVGLVIT